MIFQVDEDFTIPAMRPAAYVLQRHGQVKDVGLADGEARPQGSDQLAFGSPPQVGDALYLGFEEPLDRLIVQIDVDASQARGAGVNPEDPPLRWEVSQADGQWAPRASCSRTSPAASTTAPARSSSSCRRARSSPPLGGHRLHWLRCRIDRHDAPPAAPARPTRTRRRSTRSPPRRWARGCRPRTPRAMEREILGVSDGTPGQIFPLRHQPGAQARRGRDARGPGPRVRRLGALGAARPDFVGSTEFDRHFVLDLVSGEVELGPAIRETDGGWTQYGAVPPKGAVLRFTRYRHGGGRDGNVTAEHADACSRARSPASTR